MGSCGIINNLKWWSWKIHACVQDAQQRVVASFPRELWNSEVAELWGGKWIGIFKEYEYLYENEHWPVLRLVRYLEMLGFSRCWKKYTSRVNVKCRKAFLYRIGHWASVPILIFNTMILYSAILWSWLLLLIAISYFLSSFAVFPIWLFWNVDCWC